MLSALNDIQESITRVNNVVRTSESSVIGPVAYSIANEESLTLMTQREFHKIMDETVEATQTADPQQQPEDPDAVTAAAVKTAVMGIPVSTITAISGRLAGKLHSSFASDKQLMQSAHRLRSESFQRWRQV